MAEQKKSNKVGRGERQSKRARWKNANTLGNTVKHRRILKRIQQGHTPSFDYNQPFNKRNLTRYAEPKTGDICPGWEISRMTGRPVRTAVAPGHANYPNPRNRGAKRK